MSAHRLLSGLAVWCALAGGGGPAAAQLSIHPVQGLSFGQLQVGVPMVVTPTDAARRAELDLTGVNGTYVISTVLPTRLVSAAGKSLPVSFAANAGRVEWRYFGLATSFNPNVPQSVWLPWLSGGGTVYLGGTASPTPTQPPGVYTATITVIISNAGT